MTKEILEQVKLGIIPDDKDLQIAINHYENLCAYLELHGDIYRLVWKDCYYTLYTLKGYKQSRSKSRKIIHQL